MKKYCNVFLLFFFKKTYSTKIVHLGVCANLDFTCLSCHIPGGGTACLIFGFFFLVARLSYSLISSLFH